MAHSFKNVKESPAKLLKAVAKAVKESKKTRTFCKDVIKTVYRSSEYDKEEVMNAIKGLCNSGYARLSKSSSKKLGYRKQIKFGNREILLLKDPCESENNTESDSDSSDDNE